MDNNQAIYNEKKLAFFESTYRESVLSKPQDVNVTITAEHIYGLAYICEQTGTREEDPVYSRFTCGLEEITKIYINNNNKNSPIYVQCDDTSKAVINRRRIILPCFKNNTEIVQMIENAKNELDKKLSARREKEKSEKLKAMKRAADDEFEKLTGGYKDLKKNAEKAASEAAVKAAETAPKAEAAPKAETKPEPAPAPAPKAEPKPAPAPAPVPKAEAKPEPKRAPAPAPAPAPKPPIPEVRSIDAAPKKGSAPKPDTEFVFESTRTIPEPENKGPVTVDDLMDLNEFLGISPEDVAAAKAKPAAETRSEPAAAPKAEAKPEPAPAPAPAPAPKAEAKPAPAPAPAPAPKAEAKPAAVIEELELPSEDLMDVVKADEKEIESIPVEVVQKNVAEIEDLVVPDISAMGEIREAKIVTKPTRRQQMAAEAESAANTSKSLTPGVAQPPKKHKEEQPVEVKEAAAAEADDENDIMKRSGVDVSLDDFETAVKKLKTMLDNGLITEAEFAGEKKKLLSLLY